MKKVVITLVVLVLLAFSLAVFLGAVNKNSMGEQSGKAKVAASFYPLYFFAQEIGKDKVDVVNITPAGAEPHEYEPTVQDIARIYDAKLLILNGAELEPWADSIKQNIESDHTKIIEATEGMGYNQYENEEGEMTQDPHLWLNPLLAKEMASKITEGLVQVDPANGSFYKNNLRALRDKLDNLDKEYKEGLKTCQQKNIITSHDAFEYLASAYALRQVPISGVSTEEEPSAQNLAQVAKFVKDNNIKYIFFESLVSPELSNTLATETGAQTLELNPIEGLGDEEIAAGKNYFTKMQDNLNNLKIALECK